MKIEKIEQINEDVLCVLKYSENSQNVIIDYFSIDPYFSSQLGALIAMCADNKTDVLEICDALEEYTELEELNGTYDYCQRLNATYQVLPINISSTLNEIKERKEEILSQAKDKPRGYNLESSLRCLKEGISILFSLWGKAYSIDRAYQKCEGNKEILAFSHRRCGWSNPIYNLSDDFSIELKTNFGYGRSSYFYTILRYKEIEITPFSLWIDYEFAKFSEIIRYTQKYYLQHICWQEAMEYARDACNISLKDEKQFIRKYIINECEQMIYGLEAILINNKFTFKKRGEGKFQVDKEGYLLVEFRGEKISGALDFISKIIEYERIIEVKDFIDRIESCNKRIQPLLATEAIVIQQKLEALKCVLSEKTPEFDRVKKENSDYQKRKEDLKLIMIKEEILLEDKIDQSLLEDKFNSLNPSYIAFKEKYDRICKDYDLLLEEISNLENVLNNILEYNVKIINYFKNKSA